MARQSRPFERRYYYQESGRSETPLLQSMMSSTDSTKTSGKKQVVRWNYHLGSCEHMAPWLSLSHAEVTYI